MVRAEASVIGRCSCGAVREGTEIRHENDCPAISRHVEDAIASSEVGWAAVRAFVPLEEFEPALSATL
jgi:hypothetical protein